MVILSLIYSPFRCFFLPPIYYPFWLAHEFNLLLYPKGPPIYDSTRIRILHPYPYITNPYITSASASVSVYYKYSLIRYCITSVSVSIYYKSVYYIRIRIRILQILFNMILSYIRIRIRILQIRILHLHPVSVYYKYSLIRYCMQLLFFPKLSSLS